MIFAVLTAENTLKIVISSITITSNYQVWTHPKCIQPGNNGKYIRFTMKDLKM